MESIERFETLVAETLTAHGCSVRTQGTYVLMLRILARFVNEPLDEVVPEHVQEYRRYLTHERKVSFSGFNQSTSVERLPYQRTRRTLPEILAAQEVAALFDACCNLKHRALLMTAYSGGLRLSETLALLPSDIDSQRMMIRVEQGKGRKDRYVMLSAALLAVLRQYWKQYRPAPLALRGQAPGPAAPVLHRREGFQARRPQGRHRQASARGVHATRQAEPARTRRAPR